MQKKKKRYVKKKLAENEVFNSINNNKTLKINHL